MVFRFVCLCVLREHAWMLMEHLYVCMCFFFSSVHSMSFSVSPWSVKNGIDEQIRLVKGGREMKMLEPLANPNLPLNPQLVMVRQAWTTDGMCSPTHTHCLFSFSSRLLTSCSSSLLPLMCTLLCAANCRAENPNGPALHGDDAKGHGCPTHPPATPP